MGHSVLPIRLLPVRSEDLALQENWITPSDRPVAFFTEPAMVIAFLTPVLLFAQQKKRIFCSNSSFNSYYVDRKYFWIDCIADNVGILHSELQTLKNS